LTDSKPNNNAARGAKVPHLAIAQGAPGDALLVVVGLHREARIVRGGARVLIGGRRLDLAERPAALLSFGLCGALDPTFKIGDMILGETVTSETGCYAADPAWTSELALAVPGARRTGIAAGEKIAGSRKAKAALRSRSGAGAVDMESHLVAEAAARLNVPFAVLRSVSDRADHAICGAAQAGFSITGRPDLAAVARALLSRPHQFPSLVRNAIHAATAFRALDLCAATLDWRGPEPQALAA
jgi:hypothetical protein